MVQSGIIPFRALKRLGEGNIYYYLQQVGRTPRIFPKQGVSEQQNWGSFKLMVDAYSWRGRKNWSAEKWQDLPELNTCVSMQGDSVVPCCL